MLNVCDLIIIGGGAAGVFAAIQAKISNPEAKVTLLEKSAVLLSKVKISGGGRCNVTHSCFDPTALVRHYPRGHLELRGPFHKFQPQDTIEWFESRGVMLKAEADGRIFPTTDSSETIIQCLLEEAKRLGVEILTRQRIDRVEKTEAGFLVGERPCKNLLLATGSSADGHAWAEKLGHTIQRPVPSLFTFNVPTSPLKELSGIAVPNAEVSILGTSLVQKGPLLITHFGFSGPAVLKLSAWGARFLNEQEYRVEIAINWLPEMREAQIFEMFAAMKKDEPQSHLENPLKNSSLKRGDSPLRNWAASSLPHLSDSSACSALKGRDCASSCPFKLPKNLWKALVNDERRLNDISLKDLQKYAAKLHADIYRVEGKTTHKEEFVTCGGVHLKEVDFKTMQSKICPGLYFAGEVLDIDGVTGGFNFQAAWTTGFIAGSSSCSKSCN